MQTLLTLQFVYSFQSTSVISAKKEVNGVSLHYQQTGRGNHGVLLLPGALGTSVMYSFIYIAYYKTGANPNKTGSQGSGQTDFGPQLKSLNKDHFTIVAWDPRGYGRSIPPNRNFPLEFFHRDAKDAVDLMQASSNIGKALNFSRFSMLGWSDGGITALIAAAQNTFLINKLVVWGSNAYVTEDDIKLYNAVRDVSKWSERMRKPMEEMYGSEYFAKTWAAWVDGICQFAKRPDVHWFEIHSLNLCFSFPYHIMDRAVLPV
ncbi:UNVERIFIED_CONTAM: hypothetical protein FKN15_004265 [Acipenser sinensis]